MATCIGLDIGYSNVKIVIGDGEGKITKTLVLPAGAGPVDSLEIAIGREGGSDPENVRHVMVDGVPFVAGLERSQFHNRSRELADNYPATPDYKALLLTALLEAETDTVDFLVTGFPVGQATDKKKAAELKEHILGKHQISKLFSTTVKDSVVSLTPVWWTPLFSCSQSGLLGIVAIPGWTSSIGLRSASAFTPASRSCRRIWTPGCASTMRSDRTRGAGVIASPQCRPSSTRFLWQRRSSWPHNLQSNSPSKNGQSFTCQIKS